MCFKLQERDIEILDFLNSMGPSSLSTLQLGFFTSKQACSRRMVKLKEAKLVENYKSWLIDFATFTITKRGHEILNIAYKAGGVPQFKSVFSENSLRHNLIVSEVRVILEHQYNIHTWKSEREIASILKSETKRLPREFLPDGIYTDRSGTRWALEVELSRKSNKRIEKRILNHQKYIREGWFQKSLMIVESESIAEIYNRIGNSMGFQFQTLKYSNIRSWANDIQKRLEPIKQKEKDNVALAEAGSL